MSDGRDVERAHAGDALGEVAVRAALEQRERGEREPAHVVERRLRDRRELGQRRRRRRQRRHAPSCEQRELARLARCGLVGRLGRSERSNRTWSNALAALELERAPFAAASSSAASSRSSTQPIGVDRSAVLSRSIAPETISRSIARVIAT